MQDFPIAIGLLIDLSKKTLGRAKEAVAVAISKLDSQDGVCLFRQNQPSKLDFHGAVTGQLMNYKRQEGLNVWTAANELVTMLGNEDVDHPKLLFYIFDDFPSIAGHGIKNAMLLDERNGFSCRFYLCGIGNAYPRENAQKVSDVFQNCTYKHFVSAKELQGFIETQIVELHGISIEQDVYLQRSNTSAVKIEDRHPGSVPLSVRPSEQTAPEHMGGDTEQPVSDYPD